MLACDCSRQPNLTTGEKKYEWKQWRTRRALARVTGAVADVLGKKRQQGTGGYKLCEPLHGELLLDISACAVANVQPYKRHEHRPQEVDYVLVPHEPGLHARPQSVSGGRVSYYLSYYIQTTNPQKKASVWQTARTGQAGAFNPPPPPNDTRSARQPLQSTLPARLKEPPLRTP